MLLYELLGRIWERKDTTERNRVRLSHECNFAQIEPKHTSSVLLLAILL